MAMLAIGAVLFHWIYYARRRPAVREFIDAVKPLIRMPFDETFLLGAILFDAAFLISVYLLVTGRR